METPILKITKRRDADPTFSLALVKRWWAEINQRFNHLSSLVHRYIVEENRLGAREEVTSSLDLTTLAAKKYVYEYSKDKQKEFMAWLDQQVADGIMDVEKRPWMLSQGDGLWTDTYIHSAYQKGVLQARTDLENAGAKLPELGPVQTAMNKPFHADRLGLIFTRTFNDMRGVTEAMKTQMSRELALGMAEGRSPYDIAYKLKDRVDHIGITRARLIARTEVIHTHNEAALNEYEALEGVVGEPIKVQWWTALDERVRATHAARHGKVMTRKHAKTLIGEPNCRCALLPWTKTLSDAHKGKLGKGQAVSDELPKAPWEGEKTNFTFTKAMASAPDKGDDVVGWSLNGQKFTHPASNPFYNKWDELPDLSFPEPKMKTVAGKKQSAGMLVLEDDGRIWLVEPKGHYGGYEHTFPKGSKSTGLTLQQTAVKEVYEESGLMAQPIQHLGDYEKSTSVTRYYVGKRVGGSPTYFSPESQSVKLVTLDEAQKLLNVQIDKQVLSDLLLKQAGKQTSYEALLAKETQERLIQKADAAAKKLALAPLQEKIDGKQMSKISGAKGSNPGGLYQDATTGDKWYIKTPNLSDQAYNEVAAQRLYKKLGIDVPDLQIVEMNGKVSVASRWVDDLVGAAQGDYAAFHKGFAADAWLANWDVAGLTFDNVAMKAGAAFRIDVGGSLMFRAQGGVKELTEKVLELESMRKKGQAATLFKGIKKAEIDKGIAAIKALTDLEIRQAVYAVWKGPMADDAIALLIKRRDALPAVSKKIAKETISKVAAVSDKVKSDPVAKFIIGGAHPQKEFLAEQYVKSKEYWLKTLKDELDLSKLPIDSNPNDFSRDRYYWINDNLVPLMKRRKVTLPDGSERSFRQWQIYDALENWQSDTQYFRSQYFKAIAHKVEGQPGQFHRYKLSHIQEHLDDPGQFGDIDYVELRALNQAWMELVHSGEVRTLYRGTKGDIGRRWRERANTLWDQGEKTIDLQDDNVAGWSTRKGPANGFGKEAGGVTSKWKAAPQHIIVDQDLFTGVTRAHSNEREFICRGGVYHIDLKNVDWRGKSASPGKVMAKIKTPSASSLVKEAENIPEELKKNPFNPLPESKWTNKLKNILELPGDTLIESKMEKLTIPKDVKNLMDIINDQVDAGKWPEGGVPQSISIGKIAKSASIDAPLPSVSSLKMAKSFSSSLTPAQLLVIEKNGVYYPATQSSMPFFEWKALLTYHAADVLSSEEFKKAAQILVTVIKM